MIRLAVFVLALLATATVTYADTPGSDWMPAEKVMEKILQAGYSQVTKIDAEDGRWEGEGIKNARRWNSMPIPRAA